jgi:XrtN system VIT domain protein
MNTENQNLDEIQEQSPHEIPMSSTKKEATPEDIKKDVRLGLIFVAVEFVVLLISNYRRGSSGEFFDTGAEFFINFFLTVIYFFLCVNRTMSFFKPGLKQKSGWIMLVLLSISCFTLNNAVGLFSTFETWVQIYLFVFYVAMLGMVFREKLPKILQILQMSILGAGLLMVLYFSIYLAPVYPFAIIGGVILGISFHAFVPLFTGIVLLVYFFKSVKELFSKAAFYIGIGIPLIVTLVFLFRWDSFGDEIHKANSKSITRPDNELPSWVLLCQDISNDPFTTKILKGNLVYDAFFFRMSGAGTLFNETKKHDPLINIGLMLMKDISIDKDTRVKILKSQFNARHYAQRKLWSERNLETTEVLNDTKIFTDYRFAYTEKTITIKNSHQFERNQQEAAYTFYLPEGSVATSLSLWIDGKEEKSRLTTKEKADEAYTKIVGVERRDPALMHWQEGNTLTVTVFPCTPKENRIFKVGITTPLEYRDDKLVLNSIYFDGPTPNKIRETSRILFESDNKINNIQVPNNFENQLNGSYLYSGDFNPYWEVSFDATPLSKKTFSFNGYRYRIDKVEKRDLPCKFTSLYLDINKSWTKHEFDKLINKNSDKRIFVFNDNFIEVTNKNKNKVFELLSKKNFSLFPFHKIQNSNESLVISKSTGLSPNLSDLEKSYFLKNLMKGIEKNDKRINLYQIGNLSSPYIRTLKEIQLFNFVDGTIDKVNEIIVSGKYPTTVDDLNQIDIDISKVSIKRDTLVGKSEAPDHLLRLFAYSRLMKELGKDYLNIDKKWKQSLVDIANEAYIVSPVSSLIVLESQKDYDRFDIKENENSLKNASMKSSGAVPEPHEWVVIVMFILFIGYMYFRKRRAAHSL